MPSIRRNMHLRKRQSRSSQLTLLKRRMIICHLPCSQLNRPLTGVSRLLRRARLKRLCMMLFGKPLEISSLPLVVSAVLSQVLIEDWLQILLWKLPMGPMSTFPSTRYGTNLLPQVMTGLALATLGILFMSHYQRIMRLQ